MLKRLAMQCSRLNVMILKYDIDQGNLKFLGSGFACHDKGAVLTASHIINPIDKLYILPTDDVNNYNEMTFGRVNAIEMKLVQYDSHNDVALILPNQNGDLTCNVAPGILDGETEAMVGSSLGYMGFPYADRGLHTLKISQSVLCGKSLSKNGVKQIHFDANVHEGNSGGPVFDVLSGRIIGIVSGRFSPTGDSGAGVSIGGFALGTESTISFATHISYGVDILRQEGLYV